MNFSYFPIYSALFQWIHTHCHSTTKNVDYWNADSCLSHSWISSNFSNGLYKILLWKKMWAKSLCKLRNSNFKQYWQYPGFQYFNIFIYLQLKLTNLQSIFPIKKEIIDKLQYALKHIEWISIHDFFAFFRIEISYPNWPWN